ncbi:MAG: rRNA pseudouridine synthase [Fusobacteria bacterium]|nr:rRNA pseudouridine synthase [Fusobacteriota bacterium]
MELIRLNKYLSDMGVAARRKIDELIDEKKVYVNGECAKLGQKINPIKDEIIFNGKKIENKDIKLEYYIINKPRKVISAVSDNSDRQVVTNLIKTNTRIFPVGRLDYETEGLLILTNDGELFNRIVHPKNEVFKKYFVKISGKLSRESLDKLKNGVVLDDGITLPAKVEITYIDDYNTSLKIEIREGRNRQIRRMFKELSHRVQYLKRVAIGKLDIGDLKPGEYRELTDKELKYLREL